MTTKHLDPQQQKTAIGALAALQRAGQRARLIAGQTDTDLIISNAGTIQRIHVDENEERRLLKLLAKP